MLSHPNDLFEQMKTSLGREAFKDSLVLACDRLISDQSLQNKLKANISKAYAMTRSQPSSFPFFSSYASKKFIAGQQALVNARILFELVAYCQTLTGNAISDEILKGAHVVVQDNGQLTERLKGLQTTLGQEAPQIISRYSSHYHAEKAAALKEQQPELAFSVCQKIVGQSKLDYSLRAEMIFNECVFGEFTNQQGLVCSWFQFEGHSHQPRTMYSTLLLNSIDSLFQLAGYSLEKFGHHLDWLSYVLVYHRMTNIGQYGSSIHTESNAPLILEGDPEDQRQSHQDVPAIP